jgi:hypothetical protein
MWTCKYILVNHPFGNQFLIKSPEILFYQLMIGEFAGLHKTLEQPMQLLGYFPIYMYDTGVAHIPSVAGVNKEMCLSLNYFHEFDISYPHYPHFFAQNILQTQNPNIENTSNIFAMKFEKISTDIPNFNRSYFLTFDVISNSDEPEKFVQEFTLFSFYISQPSNQDYNYVEVLLDFNLEKTKFLENNFYHGTMQVKVRHFDALQNLTQFKEFTPFTIDRIDAIGADFGNFYSETDYLNSNLKDAGFFSVVKPLSFLSNVPF